MPDPDRPGSRRYVPVPGVVDLDDLIGVVIDGMGREASRLGFA